MVSSVQWGQTAHLSAGICQPQSPGPKLTAGIQKKTVQSALIFSGKGQERIKTSTVQSKMERHEQLIRTGAMLKCTCSNLWREYFFLDKLFTMQVHGVNPMLICQDMDHST